MLGEQKEKDFRTKKYHGDDLFQTTHLTNKENMTLSGYISCSRTQSEFIMKAGLEPRSLTQRPVFFILYS